MFITRLHICTASAHHKTYYGSLCKINIFSYRPLNIPSHNYYLGFLIVQFVSIPCMIVVISHHDRLGFLSEIFFLNLSRSSYVFNTSKIQEKNNDLGFFSIENPDQICSTIRSIHDVSYSFAHMHSLCPSQNILWISVWSIFFHTAHLTSLVIITILVFFIVQFVSKTRMIVVISHHDRLGFFVGNFIFELVPF